MIKYYLATVYFRRNKNDKWLEFDSDFEADCPEVLVSLVKDFLKEESNIKYIKLDIRAVTTEKLETKYFELKNK